MARDQRLTPSATFSTDEAEISHGEFPREVRRIVKIIAEEFIDKQERVRIESERRKRYLDYLQEIQSNAKQELNDKFNEIQQKFQRLNEEYQQVNKGELFSLNSLMKTIRRKLNRRRSRPIFKPNRKNS